MDEVAFSFAYQISAIPAVTDALPQEIVKSPDKTETGLDSINN
jgi:hypothetical protein